MLSHYFDRNSKKGVQTWHDRVVPSHLRRLSPNPHPLLFPTQVIDPIAPRYTALEKDCIVPLTLEGAKVEYKTIPKHPKVCYKPLPP